MTRRDACALLLAAALCCSLLLPGCAEPEPAYPYNAAPVTMAEAVQAFQRKDWATAKYALLNVLHREKDNAGARYLLSAARVLHLQAQDPKKRPTGRDLHRELQEVFMDRRSGVEAGAHQGAPPEVARAAATGLYYLALYEAHGEERSADLSRLPRKRREHALAMMALKTEQDWEKAQATLAKAIRADEEFARPVYRAILLYVHAARAGAGPAALDEARREAEKDEKGDIACLGPMSFVFVTVYDRIHARIEEKYLGRELGRGDLEAMRKAQKHKIAVYELAGRSGCPTEHWRTSVGLAYECCGAYDRAADCFREGARTDMARLNLALALLQAGRRDEARRIIDELPPGQIASKAARAWRMVAGALLLDPEKHAERRMDLLMKALDTEPRLFQDLSFQLLFPGARRQAWYVFRQGLAELEKGKDLARARRLLEGSLSAPGLLAVDASPDFHLALSDLYRRLGRKTLSTNYLIYAMAEAGPTVAGPERIRASREAFPSLGPALRELEKAQDHWHAREYAKAEQCLGRALDRVSLGFFLRVRSLYRLASGQWKDDQAVLRDLDAALAQNPFDPVLHLCRAQALRNLGRLDSAEKAADAALRLHPKWKLAAKMKSGIAMARAILEAFKSLKMK